MPHGHAVLRLGAKRGNRLYVTGTIGDAHLGLRLLKDPKLASRWGLTKEDVAFLAGRYREPQPRTTLALALRNFAAAAIDVSDGLVGDVDKLSSVSHGGAVIEAASVPLSPAAAKAVTRDPELLEALLTGGDDYEIVAAVPEGNTSGFEAEAKSKGVTVTRIGRIEGTSRHPLARGGRPRHEARAQGIHTLLGCWRPVRGEFPGGRVPHCFLPASLAFSARAWHHHSWGQ